MNAQRTYRPDTVSVAKWEVKDLPQETLWDFWRRGSDEKIDAPSFAASIPLRQALKDKSAKLVASKRPGRIVITATI